MFFFFFFCDISIPRTRLALRFGFVTRSTPFLFSPFFSLFSFFFFFRRDRKYPLALYLWSRYSYFHAIVQYIPTLLAKHRIPLTLSIIPGDLNNGTLFRRMHRTFLCPSVYDRVDRQRLSEAQALIKGKHLLAGRVSLRLLRHCSEIKSSSNQLLEDVNITSVS